MQDMRHCSIMGIYGTNVSGSLPSNAPSQWRDVSRSPLTLLLLFKIVKSRCDQFLMWMNISRHTRVRHFLKKREEEERYVVRGEIILRCMRSHPKFPSPCPAPCNSTDSLSGPVYCNRRAACEYPVLSCNGVSVGMCVRTRWFMIGVWWDCRVMSCYCRRCHKMFVSSSPNGSVCGLSSYESRRLGGGIIRSAAAATAPGMHMHMTGAKRHSVTNRMLKRAGTDCKWEEQRGNNTSVKWGRSTDIKQAWVASPQITFSQQQRERARMLPQQPFFPQLSAVQWRRWRIVFEEKEKTLSGLIL